MLIDRIQSLEVVGKPVAMVPNRRERLYVTGTEEEVGLAVMADLAEEGAARAVSA